MPISCRLLLPFLFALLAAACLPPDEADPSPALVVEGWIDSDGYPVVMLTRTVSPAHAEASLSDLVVRWGRVSLSDGDTTLLLTGAVNSDYFPPFVYRSYALRGQPGRIYTLQADYADLHVSAQCTMPAPIPIDSIRQDPIADGPDTLRAVTLTLRSPGRGGYVRLFTRVYGKNAVRLPAVLGTYALPDSGQTLSIPVYRGRSAVQEGPFEPQMAVGDTVEITLAHIAEPVYRFWTDYDNAVLFGGSQFVTPPQSIRSNVSGGYGVWSAQGVTRRTVIIR